VQQAVEVLCESGLVPAGNSNVRRALPAWRLWCGVLMLDNHVLASLASIGGPADEAARVMQITLITRS
jgi:hypothetical protein